MLILLDENIPHSLRLFSQTMQAADEAGFDALITADHGIRCQQNRFKCRLALVVLSSNKEAMIVANVDSIKEALTAAVAGALVFG